jgi:anti-anti-sigma regulatory factor
MKVDNHMLVAEIDDIPPAEPERSVDGLRQDTDMTNRGRAAAVKQLPETVNAKQRRLFLKELDGSILGDRPCLVLDCSKVREMDKSVVHLLLCCLEEAMKRNGDAKLAAVPAAGRAVLERLGVNRLFEMFDTVGEALSSFRRIRSDATLHAYVGAGSRGASENAA